MIGGPLLPTSARTTELPNATTYRLLAIDLDGTLLDSQHGLPPRTRAALHAAHERGLKIVLCTGRSFTETRPILDDIGLDLDATITVGGALLTDIARGETIASTAIAPALAQESTQWFLQRGYVVLWLGDASVAGFDGYVIDGPRRHPAIDRWIETTPCQMRCVVATPADDQAPLRITVVDDIDVLDDVSTAFQRVFERRLTYNVINVPMYGFTVLEAFAASVDKWVGITQLCQRWGIDPRQTVAIGDDVNDLPMIRNAGLGAAVANAKPAVKSAARQVVASNEQCGVAELIEKLLRD
jgi:hypothetical protein